MKSKFWILISVLVIVGMVLSACAKPTPTPKPVEKPTAAPAAEPIKIAILAPLSGDVKTFGESTRDGALMAFEEWNAKGGVLGQPIEIIIGDSKCDAQEAANAANKVIFEDGVKYIVGAVCSSASIPISEIAEAEGVLQISPTSTNPAVTINEDGSNKEYVFRACFLDPFQGEVVAALAMELGAKTSAVLYDVGNDYVKGLAEYYKAAFESMGGTVPVFEAYTKEDTDFSAILTKVAAANPDALFLPDYYSKNNLIAAQIKEKGITAQLLGGDGWDSPELDLPLFEGGYHSNHYSPADPRPLVKNFVQAYTDKYGAEPDALATLAYDAAHILCQSIENAGVDDPAAVKDAMAALKFEGVSGEITFDDRGDPVKKAAIIKVEGGKKVFYKFVAPAAPAATVAEAPGFPVKIAILAPLSGDVKTFGESTRDGALMAFEEAAAAGWDIEIVIGDSKCDAQEAANAANKVIFEDGVKYIVGAVCSSASIPISEIAEAEGVLQISPTSTNPAVTINEDGSNKEYVFRACFLDPFQGEVVAALAMELGAKTSAVLYDVGNDYVKGLAEYYKAAFESMGGTVPVFEAYTKEDTDFSAILTKVAAANPDALFLPDYYSKNNLIAAQIKEKGITAQLLGGDGWDSPELDLPLFEGGYHSNHYSPADPRPLVKNFVQAYTAKYGAEPDALATLAYDAAKILLQSISEAGVDDPAAVKDKMAALKFEGVSGDITFDDRGDPVKKAAIIKVEGGKKVFYKFVAPAAPAEKTAFVIGTDATWPPMEFVDENKNIVGFDIDMMNAIAETVGIEVEFKNVSWDGIFAGLEAGEYDAILSCVTITDERKEVYDFSDPYLNAGQTVVVRAGETRISSHEDLSGMIAGAQIGTTGAFAIEKISGATLREYDTIDLAFFDLLNNNIDAVVADAPVAADYALVSDQFKGKLQVAGEAFTDEYLGLVVRKGDTALVSKFNEGLEKIKASGQYDEFYKKWIAGEPAPAEAFKVGMITDVGGIDDKSFNATSWKGVADAIRELGVEGRYLESQQQTDYAKNITEFLQQDYDMLVTVGFLLGDDTAKFGAENPDVPFAIVDYAYDPTIPNVMGLIFNTDGAAFLAGYLAAGMTKTGKVGTFGGIDIPPVTIFMVGFEHGVKYYNEKHGTDVEVLGTSFYVGNFESTDDGRRAGESLMDEGADIVMPVAGPVGLGTAAAVQERGGMLIGVDTDWYVSAPEYQDIVLTSVLKNMDVAVYAAIESAVKGTFEGGVYVGTLANNGVGLAPFNAFDADVSAELKAELEEIKQGLIDGTISTGWGQ